MSKLRKVDEQNIDAEILGFVKKHQPVAKFAVYLHMKKTDFGILDFTSRIIKLMISGKIVVDNDQSIRLGK